MACQAVPSNHHQPGRAHPSTTIAAQLKCTSKVPLDEQGCFLKAPFAKVCRCAVGWRCAAMPKLLRQLQRAEAQLDGTHGSSSGSLICCTYSSATSMPAVNNTTGCVTPMWRNTQEHEAQHPKITCKHNSAYVLLGTARARAPQHTQRVMIAR
jgi:hypothetical protein